MAEMNTDSGGGHKKKGKGFILTEGGSRAKKVSTRVDMTPMVDLGFLLITFFIFTTTMSKPASMEVNKPDTVHPPPEAIKVPESRTMTVILGKEDKIFWYMGINDPNNKKIPQIHTTDFSEYGMRKSLIESDKKAREDNPNPAARNPKDSAYAKEGLIVIIRPADNSNYKNIVDILDEMKVTNIKSFSWADIAPVDKTLLEKSGLNQ
jgi:biopolymer transport protein ExbD